MLSLPSSVSSTIRSFAAELQRRRRPPSVMISTSDMSTRLGICLSLQVQAQVSGRKWGQLSTIRLQCRLMGVVPHAPGYPFGAVWAIGSVCAYSFHQAAS